MAFHAKLPPSGAHRWMNCAGSVNLIGDEPGTAGVEAMRGTAAHKVVETMLQNGERDANDYHHFNILVHLDTGGTLLYSPGSEVPVKKDWHLFICDDTMVAGVQMMLDEVDRVVEDCFDPELFTERFLNMSWLDDRLGGTADVTIADPDWIHLLDYKNGRVLVEVKDNEQMKNYAVGLLHEHPEARGVTVHLVQPNGIHEDGCIREESYTADELKLFELQMKKAADATAKPNALRRAGDWCQYCPAKIRCPEFEAVALAEAGMDFASDPAEVPPSVFDDSDDELAVIDDGGVMYRDSLARKAKWIPVLDQWVRDIKKAIFTELMNERDVPGKKLVHGKSNRAWGDKDNIAGQLIAAGVPEDQVYTDPKVKSPAQIEKVRPPGMKPAVIKKIVAEFAFKPLGRITVADADDAREAVDPASAAAADFAGDDAAEDGDFE